MLHIETRLEVRKIRLPSSRRFSIGAVERSSTRASAASRATLATPVAMMTGLAQPRTGDSLTVYKNSARPPPASTKPATSSRPWPGSRCSARNSSPMTSAATPNGRSIHASRPGIDRAAIDLAPHKVVVLPRKPSRYPLCDLGRPVQLEDRNQRWGTATMRRLLA